MNCAVPNALASVRSRLYETCEAGVGEMTDSFDGHKRNPRQPMTRYDRTVEWLKDVANDVLEQRSLPTELREPLDELRRADRARKRAESAQ